MRIALAQIGSIPGDFTATVERMVSMAQRAERAGADIVVFPATVLCGAYPLGLSEYASYELDMLRAVQQFAELTPITSVVPAYVNDGERGYVEVFVCEGSVACPVRRRKLYGEAMQAASELSNAVVEIDGVEVLFAVGDSQMTMYEMTSDAVIFVAPMPFCDKDATTYGISGIADSSFLAAILESPCWVGSLQGVGAYDDIVFAGGSFATAPGGTVVAACSNFEDDLAVFDVPARSVEELTRERARHVERHGDYVGLSVSDIPSMSGDERCAMLYRALCVSVRDYVRKSSFSNVVIGLSGGIDSAVVAALAADALGPEHVLGVLMPGPFSSEGSVTDALDLAGRLGIETIRAPITGLYDAACPLLETALGEPFEGLARENLQARLRGCLLMAVSNARSALVLNTTNKSESGMGYSTLYGDTVGAYAPLADIYKGRVYELAHWRNGEGSFEVIPRAIIEKAPSAELSENQTDEASMGVPYDLIDRILYMHVERGMDASQIVRSGVDSQSALKVLSSCRGSEFKRRQEPMGPIVSTMPFADRGWPVVLSWRDHIDDARTPFARLCDDDVDALEDERMLAVSDELDAMLESSANSQQVVGMIGDVTFGTSISGRGPDMDSCLGLPIFSKN